MPIARIAACAQRTARPRVRSVCGRGRASPPSAKTLERNRSSRNTGRRGPAGAASAAGAPSAAAAKGSGASALSSPVKYSPRKKNDSW
jgi:hypothetical protein